MRSVQSGLRTSGGSRANDRRAAPPHFAKIRITPALFTLNPNSFNLLGRQPQPCTLKTSANYANSGDEQVASVTCWASHQRAGRGMVGIARAIWERAMSAFVIFDVEIRDPESYQDFMRQVKPAIEAAAQSTSLAEALTRCTRVIGLPEGSSCLSSRPWPLGRVSTTGLPTRALKPSVTNAALHGWSASKG